MPNPTPLILCDYIVNERSMLTKMKSVYGADNQLENSNKI